MDLVVGLAIVLALGMGAEWCAWLFRLPSVLVLLSAGFIAGPVLGILDPDALLGDALVPLVSASVGIILFEGSLTLRVSDLGPAASIVRRLLTVGVVITWAIGSAALMAVLGLGLGTAVLTGAILVITGPTVIIPLLLHLRPSGQAGAVLRWEGVMNDPIGAVLAVLVYEGISAGAVEAAGLVVAAALVRTVFFGGILGVLAALFIVLALKRYWLPDFLHSPVALAVAVAVFAVSNMLQADSGLLAVTVMGIVLANQRYVSTAHIVEFKENLRVLLISALFILLAARMDISVIRALFPESLFFLAVLVLLARPVSVLVATARAGVPFREKVFMSWLAPRGIVAASIASVFASRMEALGYPDASLMEPIVLMTIIGTVVVYGFTSAPVARRLRLAEQRPQGILIVGADEWIREIALVLKQQGINKVVLVDSNWAHLSAARLLGLRAVYSSVVSHFLLDELDLGGIGRLFALSPVDEFNTLAVQHFSGYFGRGNVYQLASDADGKARSGVSRRLSGRILFGSRWTFSRIAWLFERGGTVKVTCLTDEFDYDAFREYYGDSAVLLFAIDTAGRLQVFTEDAQPRPRAGHCLVSVIDPGRPVPGESSKKA